jgi:hypothetical protein
MVQIERYFIHKVKLFTHLNVTKILNIELYFEIGEKNGAIQGNNSDWPQIQLIQGLNVSVSFFTSSYKD